MYCPYFGYLEDCEFISESMYRQFSPPGGPPPPGVGPQGPGGPGGHGAPSGPPPSITPHKAGIQTKAIESGAVRPCQYRYIYIWLDNGSSFWAYLTYVGRKSISGWRWNGRRWVYFGIDTRRIESFVCY